MGTERVEQLRRSWDANAAAWAEAVRGGAIPSRRAATDDAIVDAALARAPGRALDLGCGEGWLARRLAERGVEVTGVDASAALIERARAAGGGTFLVGAYDELARGALPVTPGFDLVVCNFALLEEDLAALLRALRAHLAPGGALLVQTVHPWSARGAGPYRDGWRVESFAGFGAGFAEPMPWFYRTLASWIALLTGSGYRLESLREPAHPESGEPLSLLLAAVPAD